MNEAMRELPWGSWMRIQWAQPYLARRYLHSDATTWRVVKKDDLLQLQRVERPSHWPYEKPFIPSAVSMDTWPFAKQPWGRRHA